MIFFNRKVFSVFLMIPLLIGQVLAELQLTENGKTRYQIILPSNASDNLKYAANELKINLEQASGAVFMIKKASTLKNDFQIILQERDPALKTGEFLIRTDGKKLQFSGGGESGIHNAVHDFLENDCGYIWYDARGGKKVPDLSNFKLPEINRKKHYPFVFRSMSADYFFSWPGAHIFLYRNGINFKTRLFKLPGMNQSSLKFQKNGILTGNGVNDFRWATPSSHTFFDYIPDSPGKSRIQALKGKGYFKKHPEWFSMNPQGKRIVRQLCFSNSHLRAEFKKNFYTHVKNTPSMNIFSVSAFDFPGQICYCEKCKNTVKKYKTNGAPVFLFVKELAEAVQKDFSDIKICTYAYRKEQTEIPPEGLKFPDNVIIEFCPIDDDMSKHWNSESNIGTYRNLKKWREICSNIFTWHYVNPWTFGTVTVLPLGNVYRCAQDIVLARKAGVTGCKLSHQVGVSSMTGFTELQSYLMARLMRNPDLDIDYLIDDFMKFEYGAAAPLMRKYLNELEAVAKGTDVFVKWNAVVGVWNSFLKSRDMVRWQGYFDEMERLTAKDFEINFSVRRVRIPLDIMTLHFFRRIKKDVPNYKTDVNTLGTRISTVYHRATAAFYQKNIPAIKNHKEKHDKALDRLVSKLLIQQGTEPKVLPREIFGKTDSALIFEFFPEVMGKSISVKDNMAAWGQAMFNDKATQGFPIQILAYDSVKGLWDTVSEIRSAQVGTEGKYCFYNIGKTAITPSFEMRIHFKGYKNLFRIFPGEVWMPGTDDSVTVYVSLKLTGPKYYPGSQKKNSIACDRIVIVRKSND